MSHLKKSIKNQSKINQKIIMKKSILLSGIALVLFSNISNAKNINNVSSGLFQNIISSDHNVEKQNDLAAQMDKSSLTDEADIFNPETVITFNQKTVKEIIAEGDKITENNNSGDMEYTAFEESMKEIIIQSDLIIENSVSNERYPLYVERTIEDEIAALELIIESTEVNKVSPLNFKKINSSIIHNSFNSNRFIGMN
ncbi:hypothetical protein C8P67_11115 [Flavobacterium aquicola]|uniref:Uncharacterized protein n=2 Tax=Flavobacterium aquicola TaxID=1682742 RepID=A0A3E0EE61_9FLAO|nr:hypothetical protein C8P67_11115 [Flavobacterium aquicola]